MIISIVCTTTTTIRRYRNESVRCGHKNCSTFAGPSLLVTNWWYLFTCQTSPFFISLDGAQRQKARWRSTANNKKLHEFIAHSDTAPFLEPYQICSPSLPSDWRACMPAFRAIQISEALLHGNTATYGCLAAKDHGWADSLMLCRAVHKFALASHTFHISLQLASLRLTSARRFCFHFFVGFKSHRYFSSFEQQPNVSHWPAVKLPHVLKLLPGLFLQCC